MQQSSQAWRGDECGSRARGHRRTRATRGPRHGPVRSRGRTLSACRGRLAAAPCSCYATAAGSSMQQLPLLAMATGAVLGWAEGPSAAVGEEAQQEEEEVDDVQVEIDSSHNVVIRSVNSGNLRHGLLSRYHQHADGRCDSPSRYRK